jgi:hypothetical protein
VRLDPGEFTDFTYFEKEFFGNCDGGLAHAFEAYFGSLSILAHQEEVSALQQAGRRFDGGMLLASY